MKLCVNCRKNEAVTCGGWCLICAKEWEQRQQMKHGPDLNRKLRES